MLLGKKIIGTISYMGGVPTVPEPFLHSWSQMIEYNADYLCETNERINYDNALISFHAAARNNLVDTMKGEWLLMLDTDHQFEPDLAARMLFCMNQYDIDVLTGIYTHKTPPHVPVIYKYEKNGFAPLVILEKNVRILEIDSAGAGCLMVRKSVFDRIREKGESPFDITHPYGEDHSFFLRLRKLKIKSYCNPHIECHHLAWKGTNIADIVLEDLQLKKRMDVKGMK